MTVLVRGDEVRARPMLHAPGLEQYLANLTHRWAKTLAALGFTLVPLFFVLDIFMMPSELLPRFAVYRGVATAIVIGQFFVLRQTTPTPRTFLHGYFFSLVVGLMIVLMTVDLGGLNSTYYAGLNLVVIAVNLLIPWHFYHSAINSALVVGLYVFINIFVHGTDSADSPIVVNNLYFLSATGVITTSITYVKQRLIEQEFFLRMDLQAARDALWGEMEVAKQIQTALLPQVEHVGGYTVSARMLTAEEVGGDYYDVIRTPHGEVWAAIGDVSGHGVESGLIMMMSQTSLCTVINESPGQSPSRVLSRVNEVLRANISRMAADRYMTLTLLRMEEEGILLAGRHQDVLVYRHDSGAIETIDTEGTWLGICDDVSAYMVDRFVPLGPKDTVVLFTDGVTEATNQEGEMFGQRRLVEIIRANAARGSSALTEAVLQSVNDFMARQDDDVTLLVLER